VGWAGDLVGYAGFEGFFANCDGKKGNSPQRHGGTEIESRMELYFFSFDGRRGFEQEETKVTEVKWDSWNSALREYGFRVGVDGCCFPLKFSWRYHLLSLLAMKSCTQFLPVPF
jgi:hypothetical protein